MADLKEYFPMIRERKEVMEEIGKKDSLRVMFASWTEEQQEEFLDWCTGVRGIRMLYDGFFKEIMNPESTPERLDELLSLLLGFPVRIRMVLPNDSTRLADECSLLVTDLVVELKGFDIDEEEKRGFFGRFKNTGNKIVAMKARYDSAEVNVNKIASALESHQVQLMKDVVMLDKLYDMNLNYHKELSMYIIAGKKKLQQERATTLVTLQDKARRSGLAEDAQAANDFAQQCDSFEKKLHDLELTRMVSVQMSPQIRLVQNNDKLMCDKIQSTLVNTIPLWKSQMVLALGLAHSEQAVRAQREVSDMTNELLRRNAEKLKMSTIETARESERGVVDMETLRVTNQSLIQTLDEVVRIQDEGRAKRRAAEAEIGRLEGELKQKLLDIHT